MGEDSFSPVVGSLFLRTTRLSHRKFAIVGGGARPAVRCVCLPPRTIVARFQHL